ncbi:MAG: stage 0 sporulation family protein [Vicinamibacterales bacterium]
MPAGRLIPIRKAPGARVGYVSLPDDARRPHPGEAVVIDLDGVRQMATVVPAIPPIVARRQDGTGQAGRVVRLASREDIQHRLRQERREAQARAFALARVRELGLAMKVGRVELQLDGSRLTVYFTAEGRVDFRELVRMIAVEFHVRVEMRQIGLRDEARVLGGYGSCGRPLCCTTFLTVFEPVSIKMAKQQNLTLNPSKLSGLCGRLKCCLRYELPTAKGETHGGCGSEGGCDHPGGCGC